MTQPITLQAGGSLGPQGNPGERETAPVGLQTLLSLAEWARRCGKSPDRARHVVDKVPDRVRILNAYQGETFAVPEGTPWPGRRRPAAPKGMLPIREWATLHGRAHATVISHLAGGHWVPGLEKRDGFWFAKADLPWPWRRGRPRKVGSV